jgi:hypothetical protein
MSDDGDRSTTKALHEKAHGRASRFARRGANASHAFISLEVGPLRARPCRTVTANLTLFAGGEAASCVRGRQNQGPARRTLAGFEGAPEPALAAPVLPWCGRQYRCKSRARSGRLDGPHLRDGSGFCGASCRPASAFRSSPLVGALRAQISRIVRKTDSIVGSSAKSSSSPGSGPAAMRTQLDRDSGRALRALAKPEAWRNLVGFEDREENRVPSLGRARKRNAAQAEYVRLAALG